MPATSSTISARRKPASSSTRHPIKRNNSSFLGTIKNLVTAPLSWFAPSDEFDDDKDVHGKRRRLRSQSTEHVLDDAHGSFRKKRLRVDSNPPSAPPHQNYLDPPSSAFFTRSASETPRHPVTRATHSPTRIPRTMSIDPPLQFSLSSRDVSMPPLSARPSFRMRTSMTPQAIHRQASDPPPLKALASNPVFVHPPPKSLTPVPTVATLGSLVESVRFARSPTRHSSLLFTSGPENSASPHLPSPAERALHELDVYKTPLLPTRLRSSNIPDPASITSAAVAPDLFKSRRTSRLVLMHDEKEDRKQSTKKSVTNETKPYAGQGGMKKLLARRKLEVDETDKDQNENENAMDEGGPSRIQPTPSTSRPLDPPPIETPDSDWLSSNAASSSGSTLRVGRSKTSRVHITRPATRPSKTKFSAAYEDPDESMEQDERDEEEQRRKDREILETAAKNVPVFNIPDGFTFANVTPKPVQDTSDAKEPPISSLPFSFSKPASVEPPKAPTPSASLFAPAPSTTSGPPTTIPLGPASTNTPTPSSKPKDPKSVPNFFSSSPIITNTSTPTAPPLSFPGLPSTSTASGFSFKPQSDVPAKPDVASTATSAFSFKSDADGPPATTTASAFSFKPDASVPSTTTSAASTFSFKPDAGSLFKPDAGLSSKPAPPSEPVKDSENPFWDGEGKKTAEKTAEKSTPSLFGGDAAKAFASTTSVPSFFGNKETTEATTSSAAPSAFTFSKPAADLTFPAASSSLFGGNSAPKAVPAPSSAPSLFGTTEAPKANLFGAEASKPSTLFSTDAPKSTSPFDAPKPTPSPSPFTFGPPAQLTPSTEAANPFASTAVEAPKPVFSNSPFSFGNKLEEKQSSPAPSAFSFNAPPSTPPAENKAGMFTFGVPAASSTPPAAPAPAPAAVGFTFSGGGSAATDVSSKPSFIFGGSNPQPERPITPPRNNDQEYRMEESPTREMQQLNKPEGLAFSFSNSGQPPSLFGNNNQGSSPVVASSQFSFGAPQANPFGQKEPQREEPKSFGGFGQQQQQQHPASTAPVSNPFSFGPSKSTGADAPHATTTGSFGFTPPTSATGPSPFSFGAPPTSSAPANNNNNNPFAQQTSSTPTSPSTFQPGFSFTPSSAPPTNAFSFGSSQPASPAVSSTNLPGSSGFGSATGGFTQPSSPFSAPTQIAPSTSSGGTLFTIGAAPAPPPAGTPRQIRKLPTRRAAGAKR